ncbi:MAG: SDR family oxidoreductase [Gammaproteobacteria bacterium]|nr:SDR family oxidoreductase [Gammaproteobacteria bacterium]
MDLGINGQTAIVTGGARGIGLACAQLLAQEGCKVAIVDIDGAQAETSAQVLNEQALPPARVLAIPTDITSAEQVKAMLGQVEQGLGAPQILIHCAAILDNKTFIESQPADWRRLLEVCLYGPMLCMHAVLPGMVERGYGRIVCIGSDAGRMGQARQSYYAAAKGGVVAQIKSIAQEVGRHGVTLNAVSPGATNTELRQRREAELAEQMGPERYADYCRKVLRRYPLGRLGEPDDIASMIVFLASARAAWTTGQVISVNGGFAMP